jgi:signal peptidase
LNAGETYERAGCELTAELLRRQCTVRIRVTGSSMAPALWPGDVIVVRPTAKQTPSIGAIAVCIRAGRLAAHRVVEIAQQGGEHRWITRGDALAHRDPAMSAAQMLGVVAGTIRADGSFRPVSPALSLAHRVLSCAIRHSELIHRLALAVHRVLNRLDGTGLQSLEGAGGKFP